MKVSCRFVPYDQWLVTHVDPAWKVKDVKLWFVRKCVHNVAPESTSRHPPSPIVFADKHRPLSPIQFAGPSPLYDEKDTQERILAVRTDPQPSVKLTVPSAYNPEKLSLIRFSTGQWLEDDFTLEWYDIKPFELLEVHRADIVFRLPRHNLNDYVEPYWEGWVRALRVILRPSVPGDPISKPAKPNRSSKDNHSAQLEWRNRWVVIRQGSLYVCKDRTDPTPSQVFHLASLSALRDADHLRRSTDIVPTANQRIVCAKFLTKTKRTSSTIDDQSNYVQTTIITSDSAAASSRSLSRPRIKLKIKPLPGLSKLSQPRRVYGPAAAEGSGNTSNTTVGRSEVLPRAISEERQNFLPTLGAENEAYDAHGASSPEDTQDDAPFGSCPEPEPVESPVNSDTSSALSSPVFAHDIDGTGSDDLGFSSEDEGQRIGYSYGYRYAPSATVRSREKQQRDEYSKEMQNSLKDDVSTMQGFDNAKDRQEHGEWIILDMADESAFASILRILHRHFPYPLASTFTSLLPSLSAPVALSNPLAPTFPIDQVTVEETAHSRMSSPVSDESRFSYPQVDQAHLQADLQYQHPVSLAVPHKRSSTFGALPYPEWRLTLTERARKAGIGQVGTVMETFLFGPAISPQRPRRRESKKRSSTATERKQSKMHSSTPAAPMDIEATDSGEESSEVEWLGWLGDLPRQEQVAKERLLHDHIFSKPTNASIAPESRTQHQPLFLETQVEDQRRFLEDRRALEPSAVVISMSVRDLVPLSSPSSTESMGPVRFGVSPGDQYPPSVSAGHSRAQSQSQLDFPGPPSTESLSLRRPSMPTVSDYDNAGLVSYSIASGTGSGSKSLSQPRSSILGVSHAPSGRNINFPIGPVSTSSSTLSTSSTTVARRASMSGLVGQLAGGSVGRAHARTPALPKKKKSGSLSESSKQDQEDSKAARELPPRRPRLSLSTSMTSQSSLNSSGTRPSSRTTSPTSVGRLIVRRVKSNSSLKSDEDDPPKKKRGLVRGVSSRLGEELSPRWAPGR